MNQSNQNLPDKREARNLTRKAINAGIIKKKSCKVCKSNKNVEVHHLDYSKPLDVMWLCRKHHNEWHSNHPIMVGVDKFKIVVVSKKCHDTVKTLAIKKNTKVGILAEKLIYQGLENDKRETTM